MAKHNERYMIVSTKAGYHGFAHLLQQRESIKLDGRILETVDGETILEFAFKVEMTESGPRAVLRYTDSQGTRTIELPPEALEPVIYFLPSGNPTGHTEELRPAAGDK
jgi:hypothetical protein